MNSLLSPMRARRSPIAALLLLLYLPACTSWHVGAPTPAQFVEREKPERAQVTKTDGSTVVLTSPVVRGDSLFGTRSAGLVQGDTTRLVGLPLSEVRSVAVRKFSTGNTLLLVGAVVAVAFVGVLIECSGKSGWDAIGCP